MPGLSLTARHLLLDPGTLSALSVFHQETHPSLMGIGTSKEGFSVFGLLNRCVTQMVGRTGARCDGGSSDRAEQAR